MSDSHDATPETEKRAEAMQEPAVNVKDESHTVPDNTNADIEAGVPQEEASAHSQDAPSSTTRRMVWIATALLALVLCVAAGWYLRCTLASSDLTSADIRIPGRDNEDLSTANISNDEMRIMISRVLKWKKAYINSLEDKTICPIYSTTPFAITDRVFTHIEPADSNTSQLDNGFGVFEKSYEVNQLNDVNEVLGAFKSEFEFKHFYAYHSLYGGLNSIDHWTYDTFFEFNTFFDQSSACREYEIIAKLFDCVNNNSEHLLGHKMVLAVMQSQFLRALLSIFAKASYVKEDILFVSHDSLNACFPMWFNGQQPNTTLGGVIAFVKFFLTVMVNAIYFSNEAVKKSMEAQPNLKLALHLTLIYNYYDFSGGNAETTTINKKQNVHIYTTDSGTMTFASFTERVVNNTPVFPMIDMPLLMDAPKQDSTAFIH